MSETLKYRGCLIGHTDWVTAIATPVDTTSNIVLSSSRYALVSRCMRVELPAALAGPRTPGTTFHAII